MLLISVTRFVRSLGVVPLTPCLLPPIIFRHALIGYPESSDAGVTICPVRIGSLHGGSPENPCPPPHPDRTYFPLGTPNRYFRPLLGAHPYRGTTVRSQGACA